MWPYFYHWGCPMSGMVIWMAFVVLLAISICVATVFFVFRGGIARPGASSARDMLDERYAKGDITREQYEQMKRDLR